LGVGGGHRREPCTVGFSGFESSVKRRGQLGWRESAEVRQARARPPDYLFHVAGGWAALAVLTAVFLAASLGVLSTRLRRRL